MKTIVKSLLVTLSFLVLATPMTDAVERREHFYKDDFGAARSGGAGFETFFVRDLRRDGVLVYGAYERQGLYSTRYLYLTEEVSAANKWTGGVILSVAVCRPKWGPDKCYGWR